MHSGKMVKRAPRLAVSRRCARIAARLAARSAKRQSICTPAIVQVAMRRVFEQLIGDEVFSEFGDRLVSNREWDSFAPAAVAAIRLVALERSRMRPAQPQFVVLHARTARRRRVAAKHRLRTNRIYFDQFQW